MRMPTSTPLQRAAAIAVLAAITLVPAILAVLGPNIDRGRIWRPRVGLQDGWGRLARLVMRHAGLVLIRFQPHVSGVSNDRF